jgi:thiamine monophosphate synthase
MRKPSLQDYRLYFVTDPRLHKGYSVLEQVELALRGEVKIIQLREKELPVPEYIKLASEALKLTRTHDAFLIINDFVVQMDSTLARMICPSKKPGKLWAMK